MAAWPQRHLPPSVRMLPVVLKIMIVDCVYSGEAAIGLMGSRFDALVAKL